MKFLSIGNRDPIQAADEPNYHRNSRLNKLVDINEDDMKLFMPHVIVMGKNPMLQSIGHIIQS